MKIVVFGANGATGHEIITQAIDLNQEIVAITRNPNQFPIQHPAVTIIKADATDLNQVREAIDGAEAIISVVGTTYSREDINLYSSSAKAYLAAMEQAGVRRLVVTSSSAVSSWEDPHWSIVKRFLVHQVLARLGRTLYADMRRMEEVVSSSVCDWTILRPLGLANMEAPTKYEVSEDHIGGSQTARRDLAAAALEAVLEGKWVQQKIAVATVNKSMSLAGTIWREGIKPKL